MQDNGKIPDDFAEKKLGYQSWVEVLSVLDSDIPDEEKDSEALKAMFYAVNRFDAQDNQRILAYQLFQISKRLTSSELLTLRGISRRTFLEVIVNAQNQSVQTWAQGIAGTMGQRAVRTRNA